MQTVLHKSLHLQCRPWFIGHCCAWQFSLQGCVWCSLPPLIRQAIDLPADWVLLDSHSKLTTIFIFLLTTSKRKGRLSQQLFTQFAFIAMNQCWRAFWEDCVISMYGDGWKKKKKRMRSLLPKGLVMIRWSGMMAPNIFTLQSPLDMVRVHGRV